MRNGNEETTRQSAGARRFSVGEREERREEGTAVKGIRIRCAGRSSFARKGEKKTDRKKGKGRTRSGMSEQWLWWL